MSLPQRIAAYDDCFVIFERALTARKGTRVAFASHGEADFFSMRMQQARALQRAEARRMYPASDTRHDKSEYDVLHVSKARVDESGEWWVYIQRHDANILAIEDLDTPVIEGTPHETSDFN